MAQREVRNAMKDPLSRLSRHYLTALRNHLRPGARASSQPALRLGCRAATLGLETLDLARIHEQALKTLAAPGGSARTRARTRQRARAFFAAAIAPIKQRYGAALVSADQMNQLNQTLRQRAAELTASTQHLQQDVARHQAAERALKQSGKHRTRLLAKSHRLQTHLRHRTHGVLQAQEQERQKISHQLQDDIAQTLLGLKVRLLSLKQAANEDRASLKKEIAGTQRLVVHSIRIVNQFAHELGLHYRAQVE
jgi:signal transduction histidine kinase